MAFILLMNLDTLKFRINHSKTKILASIIYKGFNMNNTQKTIALAIGGAFALSIAATSANAAANPFTAKSLSSGYQVADADVKAKDGKCGTGKCGADKKAAMEKAHEGACSADKAKEGSCSADKAAMAKEKEGACSAAKAKEGSCSADKK